MAVAWSAQAQCNDIDFNNDGLFPDTQDQDDFLSVFAGGPCSTGDCDEIDFNNDSLFPDTLDIDTFIRVFSGGPCVVPDAGWTVLPPLPDGAREVFIADSGSETNDGLTPQTPKRRWPSAWSATRSGFGDRICIVGDLTLDEINGASINKSNVVVYGDATDGHRPIVLRSGTGSAFHIQSGGGVSNVSIMHLDIRAARSSDGWADKGISMYAAGENLLIEGCSIDGFRENISLDGINNSFVGVRVRRNSITNAYQKGAGGHSQGLYTANLDGVLVEENVFDHNGWSNRTPGASGCATDKNHNYYCASSTRGVRALGNIVFNGAATGLQLRCNYVEATNNLLGYNPLQLTAGHADFQSQWPTRAVYGRFVGNVAIGSADITPLALRGGPAFGWGLCDGMDVRDNIAAFAPNATTPAFRTDTHSRNVNMDHNYVCGYAAGAFERGGSASESDIGVVVEIPQERAFPTISDYMASFKLSDTSEARFLELARANRKGAWDERWTAKGFIEWARAQ